MFSKSRFLHLASAKPANESKLVDYAAILLFGYDIEYKLYIWQSKSFCLF